MHFFHSPTIALLVALLPATQASTSTPPASPKCPSSIDLPDNLTNASLSSLPPLFSHAAQPAQDPSALEQIRNTLALYPLCIDGKDFASLSRVFTPDAVANYSSPLNILTPLSKIQSALAADLKPVTTQHAYGTQVIELFGECAARSVTYFRATHFGMGGFEGEVLEAWGQYRDVLVWGSEGWRVRERTLAYMGPLIGNLSIFTQ